MKILISDEVSRTCIEKLEKQFEVHYKTGLTSDELLKSIAEYDAWVVRSATKVTSTLINAAKKLKIIGRAGAGVDNIDVDAATQKGIIVMNTPGGNTISTAEHTIAMIMSLSRNIPQASQSVKGGEWKKNKFIGTELFGKTLGVLGIGKVGREVAMRMKSFGMNIIGFDPILAPAEASKIGVDLVVLDELLARSDFITIHTPLNKATQDLLNWHAFQKCKDGVRIVNCARGGIINENDLLEALQSGKVSGVALDVFNEEPPGTNNPLVQLPNVIPTPHLGASTEEAQEKVAVQIAEQILDAFEKNSIRGAVNMVHIDQTALLKSAAYLDLANRLGSFIAQAFSGPVSRLKVSYFGDILNHQTELLTSNFLVGLFDGVIENVNIINAPAVAKKQGIVLNEIRSTEHQDYTHLITIELCVGESIHLVSGALYGKNDPRLVAINEFMFDSRLNGFVLKISNEDKPGMIGKLGTILGRHHINIAQMSLGRKGIGGKAMTILNLDHEIPAGVQNELLGNGFYDAYFVRLNKAAQVLNFQIPSA